MYVYSVDFYTSLHVLRLGKKVITGKRQELKDSQAYPRMFGESIAVRQAKVMGKAGQKRVFSLMDEL